MNALIVLGLNFHNLRFFQVDNFDEDNSDGSLLN